MATPTNAEQELLELINRARMDPAREAARLIPDAANGTGVTPEVTNAIRFFNVDVALFYQQMAAYSAVAPLAWNSAIADAAQAHSAAMIAADQQSHQISGEAGLGERIERAGYSNWSSLAENIYAYGSNVKETHAAFMIDWGPGTGGMQTPAGHRINIMNGNLKEVGIDITNENNGATRVGPLVVTEDFGSRFSYTPQILGVAFRDGDGDNFYDAGEGLGGVSVTAVGAAGTYSTTTWSSGGYQIAAPAGTYTVTFAGGGLSAPKTSQITIAGQNVKLDVNAASLGATAGTAGADIFVSTAANESFNGLAGRDTVKFGIARNAATVTVQAGQSVTVAGTTVGTDTLVNIERLQFSDSVLAFDTDGNAGQVYRLYQAAFARTPDTVGLSHNIHLVDTALTLRQMAGAFEQSAEFTQRYGASTTDAQYITLLYQNVLHRGPDATGYAGWQQRLADGTWSRADVLIGFSESPENQANVAGAIQNGILLDLAVAV